MKRFTWTSTLRAILAIVTLALTMGFVPGASPGANAGTVGPDLSDTMGFLDGQIEAAVYYPAETDYDSATVAVAVDDDGNVYSATNWGGPGDLGVGTTKDNHLKYANLAANPRLIIHKVDPNGVQLWSWELNGRGYNNYDHFDDSISDPAVPLFPSSYGYFTDIVVDDDGNTYATGYWAGMGVVPEDIHQNSDPYDLGDVSVIAKTMLDGIVVSIDPDGNTRWVKVLHSYGDRFASNRVNGRRGWSYFDAVDVDNNGNVVVMGKWINNVQLDMDHLREHDAQPTYWEVQGGGPPDPDWAWIGAHTTETKRSLRSAHSPYMAKLNASDGTTQWRRTWAEGCAGIYQENVIRDVKFLSDGDIVAVGAYNDKPIYDCDDRSLDGEQSQRAFKSNATHSQLLGRSGARSNLVKISSDGDFMWGREFGSISNINATTELAVHPTNDDLYIVGVWEQWNNDNNHVMSPSIPQNTASHSGITFTHDPTIKMAPSDHEPQSSIVTMCGKASKPKVCPQGWQVNQDTYLLHTDKHGNYKNHETYDVHLEKDWKPSIAINSDGSELVIANTGYLQAHVRHSGQRNEASGWVMTVNTADLTPKWTTISEPVPLASGVVNSSSRWRDVQYGPNDNVYVAGQWYNQMKFGETAAGEEVLSHSTKFVQRPDAVVIRYDTAGNVAALAVPPPVNVAPDGYGIITGPTTTVLLGPGSEVVWKTPLCKGGRWEVTPQPGIAVREYMILKDDLAGIAPPSFSFGGGVTSVDPSDWIRTMRNNGTSTVPNYNILWQDGFLLDEDGSSSTWPETFKLYGWDTGIGDLDAASDRPVGFYFRNGVFTYNTNSGTDPSVYEPATEVSGHSWDLELYDTYLAFAHPQGSTSEQIYPEFEQKGCEPGEFVLCSGTSFDCTDTYGFTVSKDDVTTTEEGGSETFTVCLTGPTYLGFDGPSADVVMGVVNTDSTEVELSTDTLVFTPDNWDDCQTITVTGLDDSIPDGDITSYINIDIDHDASSYEYADVPNDLVTVVNENGTELVDLLPPPPNPDLDGDGILNIDEVDGCVLLADCDGDGINDGNEIFACMLAADCDGDGVGDNEEQPGCIQDPSCTGVENNPVDEKPVVVDPLPVEPPNPDPPEQPPIDTPPPPDDPQPEPDPPPVDNSPDLPPDTDGDGIPDDKEELGCVELVDCDFDGILDPDDSEPTNPDLDNDGLVDGLDPDSDNPDSDGDGIPDGEDSDADGDGEVDCPECDRDNDGISDGNDPDNSDLVNPDNPDVRPGDDPDGPVTPSDTDDGEAPLPVQTPDTENSGRGLGDRLGNLPLAAVAAAAALAVAAAAAAAASLAGPSLLSWLFRGSLGVWLFGLLFGRRGVRCSSCDLKLLKQAGLWVDKDTEWVVGINNHTHVPADFSDKDRDKYVAAVQQILQRSDR